MTFKSTVLSIGAVSIAMLGFGITPALSKEVTIRGASCFPIGSPPGRPFEAVVKAINAKGKGVLQIKFNLGKR